MQTVYRDHTFLGMTQSLCPECLELLPAKIVERDGRVYFQKRCRDHGPREDFVCSDVRWWDRLDYSLPGKIPAEFAVEPARGCPYDCGVCTDHEQHTCLGIVEINSACNLTCPMCYASSGPGGNHLSLEDCQRAIDRLVQVEGQPEILQLSGGEPTIHPQFLDVWRYATEQPIDIVMINTNGVRLANDRALVDALAERRHRTEIYLQLDGFADDGCRTLRGEALVETKLRAIERLGAAGLRTILVCTVQTGVNDHELGALVRFAVERPWITGVSFQPACYVGRHVLPAELEQRSTFPQVIQQIQQQTAGDGVNAWRESDFSPLPCAHPNGHTLAYAYRKQGRLLPLARFVNIEEHLDLLSGRITFNRPRAKALIDTYLSRLACGGGDCGCAGAQEENVAAGGLEVLAGHVPPAVGRRLNGDAPRGDGGASEVDDDLAAEFLSRAIAEDLAPEDVFRITTTSFMDAYNFDVRQLMKSCVHFVLPSGHVVPFSAYNVLYREGHVPLPELLHRHIPQTA
ncbi:MAG: molybdenum cofactor biosynthesis protein MoaA [Planctomycetaceae bacterium]|nr:molybdenum cofactor biosynthesis protein MoaA [Planctomycetaceae bacterium]